MDNNIYGLRVKIWTVPELSSLICTEGVEHTPTLPQGDHRSVSLNVSYNKEQYLWLGEGSERFLK